LARSGVASCLLWASLALAACEHAHDDDCTWQEGALGTWRAGLQVGQADGCSTSIVRGLAQQLIDEVNCIRPGTLVSFADLPMQPEPAVWPYLQAPAVEGLRRVVEARGGEFPISSALRTLPQQYLLYRWWQAGQCGIQVAAQPGRSPHERGLAVDTPGWQAWRPSLEGGGFDWYGDGDRVHFDWRGGGETVDLSGLSVLAFQRLWNRNHPDDRIAEDGDYGPQTESKLRVSPAEGFAVGGCVAPPPGPDAGPPDVDAASVERDATPPVVDAEVLEDAALPPAPDVAADAAAQPADASEPTPVTSPPDAGPDVGPPSPVEGRATAAAVYGRGAPGCIVAPAGGTAPLAPLAGTLALLSLRRRRARR
jgi:hypothetical protein